MAHKQEAVFDPIPKCNLGDLVAENNRDLKSRYVQNPHYELAESPESGKTYFVGKKGFGKSEVGHVIDLPYLASVAGNGNSMKT